MKITRNNIYLDIITTNIEKYLVKHKDIDEKCPIQC